MFINKLNFFNKAKILEFEPQHENSSVNYVCENKSEIVSPETATALKAINFSKQVDYTFLRNIKIPHLNLSANLYLLKNGQKCLIAKKDGPFVIKTYFKVGSMNEPDNLRGISHYIEHNLFNGSENLSSSEFVERVNRMGGKYNASTGFISTSYYIQSPLHTSGDLEDFIKMHADMISKPTFAQNMLTKEKGPVISEIQMLEDNPYNLATNIALKNLFRIKTQSSDLIGGSVKNIDNLTRDDVVNFYKSNYDPKDALTVVIGDVDERQTLDLLSQNFSDFISTEKHSKYHEKFSPINKTIRQDLYSPNTQSTVINLAFAGPKNDKNKMAVNLLLYALTGYKNAHLTEAMKKLNLEVSSSLEFINNAANDPSVILFSTCVPENNHEEVLKLMYQKIYEMAFLPITEDELNTIKDKMRNQYKYTSESNLDLATLLGSSFVNENNFDSLTEFDKNLNAVTQQDIMNAAKSFLDLNKVSMALVHPIKKQNVSFTGSIDNKLDIKNYKTLNNAEISILNSPNSQLYSLNFILRANIIPEKSPISLILANMLSKGTSLMDEKEYYDIEDKNNIISEPSVNYNSIKLEYSFPKESLDIVLDNLNKNLFYPAITLENFEKAKKEIKNFYLSYPKLASDRANEILYSGTPKSYSLRKIYEDLDKVTFEDVVNYYKNFTNNAQCKVALSGDFSDKSLIDKIYNNISNNGRKFLPSNTLNELEIKNIHNTKIITEVQERNQADIAQLFRIKETGNIKDKAAIMLLNEVLGGNSNSRLFSDLREKQKLAYQVNSSYNSKDNEGTLTLRIFTTTEDSQNPNQFENLQKAIDGFRKHIENLVTHQIKLEELEAAKLQIKSKLLFGLETTAGKNAMLTISMDSLYREKYLASLFKAINDISTEDIRKIASYYLTNPSVISVIASDKTIKKNEKYLKSLGDYKKF